MSDINTQDDENVDTQQDDMEQVDDSTASDIGMGSNNGHKRRGEYGFYPPALRVRIAKVALEKGVGKAADYFSDDLDRYVSPSTVASIRNQYLKEVSQCIEDNVSSIGELPKASMGRPLLMDEFDSQILQCVKKLNDSGGVVNAVVIKRIARDIIIANNKSLLLEFGGPFELSAAWAERTLKRIGHMHPPNEKDQNAEVKANLPGLEETKNVYVNAVANVGLPEENLQELQLRRSRRVQAMSVVNSANIFNISDIDKSANDKSALSLSSRRNGLSDVNQRVPSRNQKSGLKKFKILQIPSQDIPNAEILESEAKASDKDEDVIDNNEDKCVDIPENELIELAIPTAAGKRKRGDYATYSAEQRISMAKMALEIGVAKTAQHFTSSLGRYVSPSSVASMRNQYRKELEKRNSDLTELPKGKRGRPLLLGNLDSEIKQAIESAKINGGKICRNVVKSIGRDIILANNQGLLKENGGPLQLTNTWAESIMKRMGFIRRRLKSKTDAKRNVTSGLDNLNRTYMDVINNAVNSAVLTHGVNGYTSHFPPNHLNFDAFVNNSTTPSYTTELRSQQQLPSHEQEAIIGLNHLRNQTENATINFNTHSNSYYDEWDGVIVQSEYSSYGDRNYDSSASEQQPLQIQSRETNVLNNLFLPQTMQITQAPVTQLTVTQTNILQDNGNTTPHESAIHETASEEVMLLTTASINGELQRSDINCISNTNANNCVSEKEILQTVPVSELHDEHVNRESSVGTDNANSPPICPPSTSEAEHIHNNSNVSKNKQKISVNNSCVFDTEMSDFVFEKEIHQFEEDIQTVPHNKGLKDEGASILTTNDTCESKITSSSQMDSSNDKFPKTKKRKRGEYGIYTSEQRMRMAKLALELGVTKAANMISTELGRLVSSSTVASMRNLYVREMERNNSDINELPKGKRGRPLLLGDLDSQICKCLTNIRLNGGVITRMVVVSVARGIILAKNKSLLKEYGGPVELTTSWAESTIRRMGFVRQKTDGFDKTIPADFENLKNAFLKRIASSVVNHSIPKELIFNVGQTSLKIVPASNWISEGSTILKLDIEDKREIASVITVTLAGDLLPLQLIYTGKTDQCHPNVSFPENWNVAHTENHLCTSSTMMQYADKLLIPYVLRTRALLGLTSTHKALAMFDISNMNQDKEFYSQLRKNNIEIVLVPTPCTTLLQPLELTVFKYFQNELYKHFMKWYSDEVCDAVQAGQNPSSVIVDLRLSVLKHLHAQWILKTHEHLTSEKSVILEGFCKAGIASILANVATSNSTS